MARRGPKPQYERVGSNKTGAPTLSTRLDPLVYQHVTNHREGARPYIERLVTEDAERTGEPLGGVPGQMQVDEGHEVVGG